MPIKRLVLPQPKSTHLEDGSCAFINMYYTTSVRHSLSLSLSPTHNSFHPPFFASNSFFPSFFSSYLPSFLTSILPSPRSCHLWSSILTSPSISTSTSTSTITSPLISLQFLSGLATECSGASLNPNELRAVIAIVQTIAIEDLEGKSSETRGNKDEKMRRKEGTGEKKEETRDD